MSERRYELPPDLTPEEERATIEVLERAFEADARPLSPWVLAGRAEALRLGRLQMRHQTRPPWTFRALVPFVSRGTPTLHGRGDAR